MKLTFDKTCDVVSVGCAIGLAISSVILLFAAKWAPALSVFSLAFFVFKDVWSSRRIQALKEEISRSKNRRDMLKGAHNRMRAQYISVCNEREVLKVELKAMKENNG